MNILLKTAFFTGLTLIVSIKSSAQPCGQLLDKPIRIPGDTSRDATAIFEQDILLFFQCNGLDSLDIQLIIKAPLYENALILAEKNNKQVTYGDWLKEINEYKKKEQYANTRRLSERLDALLHKKVTPGEWPKDSLLLTEIGLPDPIIQNIREVVLSTPPGTRTYEAVIKSFEFRKNDAEVADMMQSEKLRYWENDTLEYPEALTLSRQQNKPILLYFSGFGAVNARKMEEAILSNPTIHRYIEENFIVLTLYVDDRTPLPAEQHYTSASSSRVRTMGGRNADLQVEKFKTSTQPYFCILDAEEKKLGESVYSRDKTSFLQFLAEGVKAFGK